jgi:hypothetical protein
MTRPTRRVTRLDPIKQVGNVNPTRPEFCEDYDTFIILILIYYYYFF